MSLTASFLTQQASLRLPPPNLNWLHIFLSRHWIQNCVNKKTQDWCITYWSRPLLFHMYIHSYATVTSHRAIMLKALILYQYITYLFRRISICNFTWLADHSVLSGVSLVAQMVKNLPAMQETQVPWVGKIPWRRNGNHSSILAWRISWTEKPCGLQSMGLQRVRHKSN